MMIFKPQGELERLENERGRERKRMAWAKAYYHGKQRRNPHDGPESIGRILDRRWQNGR